MRTITGASVSLVFLLSGALAHRAHAESVESRIGLPANEQRIRGATTILPVPWGMVALGGSTLRHLPTGKTQWETLHRVEGDNLYRISGDDTGRLLASWEGESQFHLFVPKAKLHITIAKPKKPSDDFKTWTLDDLYLAKDGAHAIVYMHGMTGGVEWTTAAYRIELHANAEPELLYRQRGYAIHNNAQAAIYVVPKDGKRSCDNNSCSPIEGIYAWENDPNGARKRTLLSGVGDRLSIARMVWAGDDEHIAMVIFEQGNLRNLLRWTVGAETVSYAPLAKGPTYEVGASRVMKNGDVVEVWRTNDYKKVEIRRIDASGATETTVLDPFPHTDPDTAPDTAVYSLRERKNGELILHWGDHLVLMAPGKPVRALNIEPMLKRRNEWAGVAIYREEPEGLWIGVEVGAGRDFVYLPFTDIDKRAAVVASKK